MLTGSEKQNATAAKGIRRYIKAAFLLAAGFAAIALTGCIPQPPEPVGRAALLAAHNDNADRIDAIWAVADVEISLGSLGPLTSRRLLDGRLYYRRNEEDPSGAPYFMLRAMEATVEVFRLGTDPATGQFHCWFDGSVIGQPSWAIIGDIEDLKLIDGDSIAAIDPVNLAAAMAIVPWPSDPDAQRQAIVRVVDKPAVYEISIVANVESWDGWSLLRREIIDRYDELLRPQQVRIHDRLGRDTMHVDILAYSDVSDTDAAEGDEPFMASDVKISPPESTGIKSMRIRLSGISAGNDDQPVPPKSSFKARMPSHITDIRILQVD